MKLISSPTSPFGRKVRIVLLEKRIPFELELDVPWSPDTKVGEANPLGKVPVLVLKDGESLYDSRVIVEYLEHLSPVGHLLPQEPKARIAVRKVEALADGIIDAAALIFMENKRPEELRSREWVSRQETKVSRGLERLATLLGNDLHYVAGKLSLADIAVACTLGYLDFRFPKIDWRGTYPNLSGFYTRLVKRESFKETVPVE
jgi:glutathione S-transferase